MRIDVAIIITGVVCAAIGAVFGWLARDFKAKADRVSGK